jgi:hypothetical protein
MPAMQDDAPLRPLCDRPISRGARRSARPLTPRLKGGGRGPTLRLRQIRHDEIHATLTEAELARGCAAIEALRGHPRLPRFRDRVRDKDPTFRKRSVRPCRRRRR